SPAPRLALAALARESRPSGHRPPQRRSGAHMICEHAPALAVRVMPRLAPRLHPPGASCKSAPVDVFNIGKENILVVLARILQVKGAPCQEHRIAIEVLGD